MFKLQYKYRSSDKAWSNISKYLHKRMCDKSGWCHCSPSSAGSLDTLLWLKHTGSHYSLVSHTTPSSHSPLWWSCSGWSGCACQRSRLHTHGSGPGNLCPRRKWSECRWGSKTKANRVLEPKVENRCIVNVHNSYVSLCSLYIFSSLYTLSYPQLIDFPTRDWQGGKHLNKSLSFSLSSTDTWLLGGSRPCILFLMICFMQSFVIVFY